MEKIAIFLLLFFPRFAHGESYHPSVYVLDVKQSKVEWSNPRMNPPSGSLPLKSGSVELDRMNIVGGELRIDIMGIPPQKSKARQRPNEFFKVAPYSDVHFEVRHSRRIDDKNVEVTGRLAINGLIHPVTIPVHLIVQGGMGIHIHGAMSLNPALWHLSHDYPGDFKLGFDLYAY